MRHDLPTTRNAALVTAALLAAALVATPSLAQPQADADRRANSARQIEPPLERDRERRRPAEDGNRSIDGSDNNPTDPEMNAVGTQLLRNVDAAYADGASALAGSARPSAREVSNLVSDQSEDVLNPLRTSDFLWQWGQFVDHDIDLTEGVAPPEWAHIAVPAGDPFFDPDATGSEVIFFNRSVYDSTTGSDAANPREQLNEITGWIDASNVYGSDDERASALRTLDGTGQLLTSDGDLLPWNDAGLPNATGGSSETLFLAGDVRANEQAALTAMHTLFVREHNRLARAMGERRPELSGDEIYQRARRIVGAQLQVITYREFLPALLGPGAIPPYRGYDPEVDATIANDFSTAAYRFGHSALSANLLRLDSALDETVDGHLALRDAFFTPSRIVDEGGIDPLLRGLAHQAHQRIDTHVIDDVRNFLFGDPGDGGFDLPALNIQRGRDHGIADYNSARIAYGLAPAESFADVTSDPDTQARLAAAFDSVDNIDLWVGGLAEDPLRGAHLGPLFFEIVRAQFVALRDGDRFWYEHSLSRREQRRVEATRLADIIRRNTDIGDEIPDDVFHLPRNEAPGRGGRARR